MGPKSSKINNYIILGPVLFLCLMGFLFPLLYKNPIKQDRKIVEQISVELFEAQNRYLSKNKTYAKNISDLHLKASQDPNIQIGYIYEFPASFKKACRNCQPDESGYKVLVVMRNEGFGSMWLVDEAAQVSYLGIPK